MISHFSKVMVFAQFSKSTFPIWSIILHMPIPTIFFSSFPIWASHSHFIKYKYIIGGPIRRSVVYYGSPSQSLPNNNNPLYLCFPFLGKSCTYSRSCIKCGSYIFVISGGVINIKAFNVANKMCSLVSLRGRKHTKVSQFRWIRVLFLKSFFSVIKN
jgi:hypothetical protein